MKLLDTVSQIFSFSKLDTFSKCPRKFFFRYVLRRRQEAQDYLLFGRAAHKGMEHDNLEKLKGRVVPLPEILDVAVADWEKGHTDAGQQVDNDAFSKAYGRQLSFYEHTGARASVRPVPGSVEAPFEIDLTIRDPDTGVVEPSAQIQGFVDVLDKDPESGKITVVDYKTGAKPHTVDEINNSLQFAMYEKGGGAEASRVISFVKAGRQKPTVKFASSTLPSEGRWARAVGWVAETIRRIRACLKSGDFAKCSPACTWCSAKSCDFHYLCYGPGSVPPKLVQVETIRPVGTVAMPEWRNKGVAPAQPSPDTAQPKGGS